VAGPEANESVVPATTAGSATLALASNRQATAGFAKPEGILDWTRHTDTPGTHGRSMSVGSYGLVLLVINCGRGGITTAAEAILTLVAWLQSCQQLIVDVILLNELHLLTGTCVVIPGYDLHWRPRPNSLLGCPSGGVGFAVRHGLELVSPPKLLYRSSVGDFIALKLSLASYNEPFVLGSVYLPPDDNSRTCRCSDSRCSKAHLEATLTDIAGAVAEFTSGQASVLIAGDFNMRFGAQRSREGMVMKSLLAVCPSLRLVNPLNSSQKLAGTRRDPSTHRESVLDAAYWSWGRSCQRVIDTTFVTDSVIESDLGLDHHPMLLCLPSSGIDSAKSVPITGSINTPVWCGGDVQDRQKFAGVPVPRCLHPKPVRFSEAFVGPDDRQALQALVMESPTNCKARTFDDLLRSIESKLLQQAKRQKLAWTKAFLGGSPQSRKKPFAPHRRSAHSILCGLLAEVKAAERDGGNNVPDGVLTLISHLKLKRKEERAAARKAARMMQKRLVNQTLFHVRLFTSHGTRSHVPSRLFWKALTEEARGKPLNRRRSVQRGGMQSRLQLANLAEACAQKYKAKVPSDPAQVKLASDAQEKRVVYRKDMMRAIQSNQSFDVTDSDVDIAIKNLRTSSAVIGPVTPAALQALNSPAFRGMLLPWIQQVFRTGKIPDRCCIIKAVLVYKAGDPNEFNNYRVIGVGDVWSRLLQSILWSKLEAFLLSNNLISDCQFGFVKGRSAEMAAAAAMMTSETLRATGHTVWKTFVDIKGAFPSVNHSILLDLLAKHGLPAPLWVLLDAWLLQLRRVKKFCIVSYHTALHGTQELHSHKPTFRMAHSQHFMPHCGMPTCKSKRITTPQANTQKIGRDLNL
jgi:hypothetical protein